jgi:hypothetical protein
VGHSCRALKVRPAPGWRPRCRSRSACSPATRGPPSPAPQRPGQRCSTASRESTSPTAPAARSRPSIAVSSSDPQDARRPDASYRPISASPDHQRRCPRAPCPRGLSPRGPDDHRARPGTAGRARPGGSHLPAGASQLLPSFPSPSRRVVAQPAASPSFPITAATPPAAPFNTGLPPPRAQPSRPRPPCTARSAPANRLLVL